MLNLTWVFTRLKCKHIKTGRLVGLHWPWLEGCWIWYTATDKTLVFVDVFRQIHKKTTKLTAEFGTHVIKRTSLSTVCHDTQNYFTRATLWYSGISCGPVSVCVCLSVTSRCVLFFQNVWMNQANFWHGGFLQPVLRCVSEKFRYIRK